MTEYIINTLVFLFFLVVDVTLALTHEELKNLFPRVTVGAGVLNSILLARRLL